MSREQRELIGLAVPSSNGHHPAVRPDGRRWLPAWSLLPPAGLEPLTPRQLREIERQQGHREGLRWLIRIGDDQRLEGET